MIKEVSNKKEWNTILLNIGNFDFYHTFEYHHILKKDEELPILLLFEDKDTTVAIPFIKRPIKNNFYDLTSTHGYLGPIAKLTENFNNNSFRLELEKYLSSNNIISVFSKLNPFIPFQNKVLKSIGKIETVSELLFFNQQENNYVQEANYKRNTRQILKKLKREVSVREIINNNELDTFIKDYHASLDRLNASENFRFDQDYFKTLLSSNLFCAKIFVAINNANREIMGGILCTSTNQIAHIELSCVNNNYLRQSPTRILFHEARKIYKRDNIQYLVLGGGSGGRHGSLMKFKAQFTQHYADFKVWKWIVNKDLYLTLQNEKQKLSDTTFFPKYRLPIT